MDVAYLLMFASSGINRWPLGTIHLRCIFVFCYALCHRAFTSRRARMKLYIIGLNEFVHFVFIRRCATGMAWMFSDALIVFYNGIYIRILPTRPCHEGRN